MDTHSRSVIEEPGHLLILQERERLLAKLLRRHGFRRLDDVRAFEAGCGWGYNLRLLVQWGARPELLAGIDTDGARVEGARARCPAIRIHLGSAERVPEADASFDLSLAFLLFSSVRSEDRCERIASELFRITRPGGLILVYDIRRSASRRRAVRPVEEADLRRWFPRCPVRQYPVTLAPPLARLVGRTFPFLYGPLAAIPLLRTHALSVVRRPALSPFADNP